jgi:hypothetical protein
MSSNLSIRFIHPDANGRGREPLEEVLAHGTQKLAFACAFMTDAGYAIISPYLHQIKKPGSFGVISIQQPTSYDALEDMFEKYPSNSYVHLGSVFDHFEAGNYVGLMHSKLFLSSNGTTTKVFCGSHNLTASALLGFNMEAATLIEGPSDDPFFHDVEEHLNDCRAKSSDELPERDNSQERRLIIELEVDDPIMFVKTMKRRNFIKFSPKGTKDQPDLTPGFLFTVLLFKRGTLKLNEPAPIADAYVNGTTTGLNLGRKGPIQGVDADFADIHFTITEPTEGIFIMNKGNLPEEDALSAVLKPQSWGVGGGIYLKQKPQTENQAQMARAALDIIKAPLFTDSNPHKIRRPREPDIDLDMRVYLKERPDIIESLLSRKRYWISRWKRRIRN